MAPDSATELFRAREGQKARFLRVWQEFPHVARILDAVEKLGLIAVCRRDSVVLGASHSENRDDGASG